jgi:hypothetical protein
MEHHGAAQDEHALQGHEVAQRIETEPGDTTQRRATTPRRRSSPREEYQRYEATHFGAWLAPHAQGHEHRQAFSLAPPLVVKEATENDK